MTRAKDRTGGRLLGLEAAATYLGIAAWSVRELTWQGTLRPVKLGKLRRLLYDRADLDALIEQSKGDSS
jgi:excisionase family DNA binding protein